MVGFRHMDLQSMESFANSSLYSGKKVDEMLLYSVEERYAYANFINYIFKDDKNNGLTPINAKDNSLFNALSNGILLCKLLNKIDSTLVPEN